MIYDENKGLCSEILLLSCPHSVIINRQNLGSLLAIFTFCNISLYVECNLNHKEQKSHGVQSKHMFKI